MNRMKTLPMEWKKYLLTVYGKNSNRRKQNKIPVIQLKIGKGGFNGGAVVKNPPANAGDTGLSPGLGRSHTPWSN